MYSSRPENPRKHTHRSQRINHLVIKRAINHQSIKRPIFFFIVVVIGSHCPIFLAMATHIHSLIQLKCNTHIAIVSDVARNYQNVYRVYAQQ